MARWNNPTTYRKPTVGVQVIGFVEASNDKGIKIHDQWYNFSKFGRVDVRPHVGAEVCLTHKQNWIDTLEVREDAFARQAPPPPPPAAAWNQAQGQATADLERERREARICRMCCVKAAATLHGGQKDATWEKCLATAAAMEAWIMDESEFLTAEQAAATADPAKTRTRPTPPPPPCQV